VPGRAADDVAVGVDGPALPNRQPTVIVHPHGAVLRLVVVHEDADQRDIGGADGVIPQRPLLAAEDDNARAETAPDDISRHLARRRIKHFQGGDVGLDIALVAHARVEKPVAQDLDMPEAPVGAVEGAARAVADRHPRLPAVAKVAVPYGDVIHERRAGFAPRHADRARDGHVDRIMKLAVANRHMGGAFAETDRGTIGEAELETGNLDVAVGDNANLAEIEAQFETELVGVVSLGQTQVEDTSGFIEIKLVVGI